MEPKVPEVLQALMEIQALEVQKDFRLLSPVLLGPQGTQVTQVALQWNVFTHKGTVLTTYDIFSKCSISSDFHCYCQISTLYSLGLKLSYSRVFNVEAFAVLCQVTKVYLVNVEILGTLDQKAKEGDWDHREALESEVANLFFFFLTVGSVLVC